MKIKELKSRESVPIYIKMKPKPTGSHLVKYRNEVDYKYYKCDYCGEEIKIKSKKEEMTGGILTIPQTLIGYANIKVALCNKCLNPLLKEFEAE